MEKATLYHERVLRGRIEGKTTAKHASSLLNSYNRNFREIKYNFDQSGLKGLNAKDVGKRANFGEGQAKYITHEDTNNEFEKQERDAHYYKRLEFENALQKDAEINLQARDTLELKDTSGMTPHEKFLEQHKRAARRNFLHGSRDYVAKNREHYKPANLKGIIKLKGELPEKSLPFSEEEFRIKIKECVNRLAFKEKNKSDKIFYTQLSKGRRYEKLKDKPKNMLNNCRQYLDFMENYILDAVKEDNEAMKNAEKKNRQQQAIEDDKIEEEGLEEDNAESYTSDYREDSNRKTSQL